MGWLMFKLKPVPCFDKPGSSKRLAKCSLTFVTKFASSQAPPDAGLAPASTSLTASESFLRFPIPDGNGNASRTV